MSIGNTLATSNDAHTGSIGVGRFLTWSSDNGDISFGIDARGIGGFGSFLERRWRVQKTANWTQGVSMYWKVSDLDIGDQNKNISLIIANNPEFSSIEQSIALTKETINGTSYFVGRNIFFTNNTPYFSLAIGEAKNDSIPLPQTWIRTDTQATNIANNTGIESLSDRFNSYTLGLFAS